MSPIERLLGKVHESPDGCWLWQGAERKRGRGYGIFWLHGRNETAHRAAWMMLRGPIPPGLFVCHRCDVPACVNPDHMFLGTATENNHDRDAKGRQRHGRPYPGQRNPNARLTDAVARTIPDLLRSGLSYRAVADRLGVSTSLIGAIRTGRVRSEMQPLFVEGVAS